MPKGYNFKRHFLTRSNSASLGPADKHLREIDNLGGTEMDREQNIQEPAKKKQKPEKPKRAQQKRAPASQLSSLEQLDTEYEQYERQYQEMMNSVDEGSEQGQNDGENVVAKPNEEHSVVIDQEDDDQMDGSFDEDATKEEVEAKRFTTMGNFLESRLQSIREGVNANLDYCQTMFLSQEAIDSTSSEQLQKKMACVQQQQMAWMRNHTLLTGMILEDFLKPAAELLSEYHTRVRRRSTKIHETKEWKSKDIVLEVANKQFSITAYDRQRVSKLVLRYQESWPEPMLGQLSLKTEIQQSMCDYFALIDQPRKIGYVVGHFLRPQAYYWQHFIPKYSHGTERNKGSDGRFDVSRHEANLFADIVLFIGGRLIAPFPLNAKPKGGTQPRNKQMDFVNIARDAVNQTGQTQREKKSNTMRNLFAHLENFVPIFEREEYKAQLESLLVADQIQNLEKHKQLRPKQNVVASEKTTPKSRFMRPDFRSPVTSISPGCSTSTVTDSAAMAAFNSVMQSPSSKKSVLKDANKTMN